jgi:hypothetical protein
MQGISEYSLLANQNVSEVTVIFTTANIQFLGEQLMRGIF